MQHTDEQVFELGRKIFGEHKLAEVIKVLSEYGNEVHEKEANRVKLAILELCEGKIDKLLYFVKTAKADYRDILAAQETGPLSEEIAGKLQTAAKKVIDRWGK
jgi:hypothetical protein